MSLRNGDHILEIGCGSGKLAALICDLVPKGKVLAIDRSAAMIARAQNTYGTSSPSLRFKTEEFPLKKLQTVRFDKIISFNVRAFWTDDGTMLKAARQSLKKDGRIYVFFQPSDTSASKLLATATKVFEERGATIVQSMIQNLRPVDGFMIELAL